MTARATQGIIKAVIDSGPLFSALTLSYVKTARVGPPARESLLRRALHSSLREDTSRQEGWLRLFGKIQSILTTSHVIGELQGLQGSRLKLGGNSLRDFWLSGMHFLKAARLDERLVALLMLYSQEGSCASVCDVGPADAGLIEMARREGAVLLTEDEPLARRAIQMGVDCRLLWNLL